MSSRYTIAALFFIAAALIGTLVLDRAFATVLTLVDVANSEVLGDRFTMSTLAGLVVAALGAGYAWLNPKSKEFVAESADELAKVSWPEWAETKVNTLVVIVFSFIAAGILGVFDSVFAWLTNNNLFLF